jgi:trans-aconitate methyltransferase
MSFPNATLHGVDGTKEMVNKAISRLPQNTNIKIMNLNNDTFTRKYDVILSTTVLHHLNNPKDHLLMIRSSLTSKGTAYISEFAIESISLWFTNLWWSIIHPAHKKTWTIKKFTNLLKQSSFKITNSKILKPDKFWILQIYELQGKKRPHKAVFSIN